MPVVNHIVITPGYFRTLGIRLLTGRDFTEADFDVPHIVIVSQSFAKKHWPRESAIGKRIRFGPPQNNEPWHTVVGVAADSRHGQLKGEDRLNVYLTYSADITPSNLLVRTAGDPGKLTKAIRARTAGVDNDIAMSQVFTLEQIIDRVAWQDRFWTVLLAAFSGLALLLAAVGLYAVLSYTVSLHKREIGIRIALGASASSIRGFVMRQGMAFTGAGGTHRSTQRDIGANKIHLKSDMSISLANYFGSFATTNVRRYSDRVVLKYPLGDAASSDSVPRSSR